MCFFVFVEVFVASVGFFFLNIKPTVSKSAL